jgi:thiol-disulfide isomerase/thioredoxin
VSRAGKTFIGIVVIATFAALVIGVVLPRMRTTGQKRTLTGPTLDGGTFNLDTYAGKPVVINFFASWCPPCNQEAPDLVAFARAHPEVGFVGVAVNDGLTDAEGFVRQYGIPYPVVFDPAGSTGELFGFDGIPTTVFLDKDGIEKARITGGASQEMFEADLKKAL